MTHLFEPIGVVRSPFKAQEGTPIQSALARKALGEVRLEERYAEALRDVEGFERIWLLFVFDRSHAWKPRVVPYRDTVPRGLFSTRAPSRPCPIGLSSVELLSVSHATLHVRGIDILDGTPLLDIKPYVPEFDAFPGSRAGWLDKTASTRTRADKRFD
jgi:tRNA-Thr(GGU) m(6)t(6)A37 methyltransferase TsaA